MRSVFSLLLLFSSNLFYPVSVILIFAWAANRVNSSDDSHRRAGLGLLAISILGNPIIDGIPSISVQTPLGKTEAIFTWLCLILSFWEVLLIKKRRKFPLPQKIALYLYFFYWIVGLGLALFQGLQFRPSFFYSPVALIILLALSPSMSDLDAIVPIFALTLVLILVFALFKYRSPNIDPVYLDATSATSVYHNFTWNLFGLTDRFRGPYQHPNALGIVVAFLTLLVLASPKKIWRYFALLGFLLLGLCASRTSIITVVVGVSLFAVSSASKNKFGQKAPKSILVVIAFLFAGLVAAPIYFSNRTLTGRLSNYSRVFQVWKISPWTGNWVAGGNQTENMFLTSLVSVGILGTLFLVALLLSLYKLQKDSKMTATLVAPLFYAFFVGNLGEAIFKVGGWDIGSLYVIAIVAASFTIPYAPLSGSEGRYVAAVNFNPVRRS